MASNIDKKLLKDRNRNYLGKDFGSFRGNLQEYINQYYSDKLSDFSESGLPGMFLDMAAYVGDTMSFYLDYQFNELDIETAIDPKNIQKHLRRDGIKPRGLTPSLVDIEISLSIPSLINTNSEYVPDPSYLPVLRSNAIATSNTGIDFELLEDCNFNEKNDLGTYMFSYEINEIDSNGKPKNFLVKRMATFVSGRTIDETVTIDSNFVPFRAISLGSANINDVISVTDSDGYEYYEVDNLSQDTIFKTRLNTDYDFSNVRDVLEIVPVPRRYIVQRDIASGVVSLVFGSGYSSDFQDDIVPPPKEIALNLFGRRTFTNFSIDTNNLLKSDTLGLSPTDTILSIKYRTGGGLSHNVSKATIQTLSVFTLDFTSDVTVSTRTLIRNSIEATNPDRSSGGENSPTIDELRFISINSRSSQSRIVSKEDLIARIYTMPANLGRAFRVAVVNNPDNPFSATMFIISRDAGNNLIPSSDSLKSNIKVFINRFRLVSDSIDILDSPVANIAIKYEITVDPRYNKSSTIRTINSKIATFMEIESFQIGTPIIKTDIGKIVSSIQGVVSVKSIKIENKSGKIGENEYSDFLYSIDSNEENGIVYPPVGGIFELKYPNFDITGMAY